VLDDAVRFVAGRLLADGPELMPAYTVTGDPVPVEDRLGLPGYPGGVDVVGNRVRDQFQLDAFGEALLLLAAAAAHDRLDGEDWRAAEAAIDAIERRHEEPDAGIWELEPAPKRRAVARPMPEPAPVITTTRCLPACATRRRYPLSGA
jgi:hypothetical protein